jgi:predicted HTH domain antitoxin
MNSPRSLGPEAARADRLLDARCGAGYSFRMTIVALTLPDDLSLALHVPAERLASEIAFAAATRLYEQGRVSLAKAAEVAGMERFGFASRLSELGIATATFDVADVEVAGDATR